MFDTVDGVFAELPHRAWGRRRRGGSRWRHPWCGRWRRRRRQRRHRWRRWSRRRRWRRHRQWLMGFVVLLPLAMISVFVVVVVEFLLRIAQQKRNRMQFTGCCSVTITIEILIGVIKSLGLHVNYSNVVLCVVVLARVISFVGLACIIILLINIHRLPRRLLPLHLYALPDAEVTEARIQVGASGADVVVVVQAGACEVERSKVKVQGRATPLVVGCEFVGTALVGSDGATAESFLEIPVGFARREILGRLCMVVAVMVRCVLVMV